MGGVSNGVVVRGVVDFVLSGVVCGGRGGARGRGSMAAGRGVGCGGVGGCRGWDSGEVGEVRVGDDQFGRREEKRFAFGHVF